MSWTPTFWLKKKDYESVRDKLIELNNQSQCRIITVYDFKIGNMDGVTITCGECSSHYHDCHDIIKHLDHWLLDSERAICDKCHDWKAEDDEFELRVSNR